MTPAFVSVADCLAGEEHSDIKHENLGCVIHAMAGGTNDDAAIAMNAGGSLVPQLRGKPCRTFGSDAKLKIEFADHIRFYYPDLQIVCRPNPGSDHFQEHPVRQTIP
jgi:Uma2 family endonuclease